MWFLALTLCFLPGTIASCTTVVVPNSYETEEKCEEAVRAMRKHRTYGLYIVDRFCLPKFGG